jgi:uncharacterized protein with HEPN domain
VKDDAIYLRHMLDAMSDIRQYASVGRAIFNNDCMRQDAIIRKLEVIGESSKKLSGSVKHRSPDTPWRQIAALGERLNHDYFGVDLTLLWITVERELPKLEAEVQKLLMV